MIDNLPALPPEVLICDINGCRIYGYTYNEMLAYAAAAVAERDAEIERLKAALEAQQEPLTEKAMFDLLKQIDPTAVRLPYGWIQYTRAIERAHGIE